MTDLDPGTDLRALMDRALCDLPTPTHRIQDGSLRRGRGVRRRRRLGAALGGLTAIVLAAGIAWPSVAGHRTTESRLAHDPGPASAPGGYERPPGWWNMPGGVMRDRLGGLLPDGLHIVDANLGDEDLASGEEPAGGWLQVDLTTGAGKPAGGLNVVLYPPFDDGREFVRERTTCPGDLEDAVSCSELHDTDGTVIGRASRWTADGMVVVEVTRLTADGGLVYAAASNSSDDKWGEGSSTDRANPPIRLAELRTLAEDATWRDWTDLR